MSDGRRDRPAYAAEGFVKVEMSDDGHTETLWAKRFPDTTNQFRLDNSPFYAYRVSADDIIEAEEIAPGFCGSSRWSVARATGPSG